MTTIKSQVGRLDVPDGTIAYEVAGSGTPLVFAHTAFLDRRMFDAQWAVFAAQFQIIRYDMIGHGDASAATGPVNRRANMRRLLDHLGIEAAHIVGCSNGGMAALDLALETPERVLSLTLVGSTPSGFEIGGEPPRYLLEMFGAQQAGDIKRASELQIRIWVDGMFREPGEVDATIRARALEMNHKPVAAMTFPVADMQPAEPLLPPALDRLVSVTCPVLVVVGDLDHPEVLRAAKLMTERIPDAQQVVISGTAHVLSFEQPVTFNEHLLKFLQG